MDGWMNQAYSRLSTTHGHITDCKLVCMYWTCLVLVRPAASLYSASPLKHHPTGELEMDSSTELPALQKKARDDASQSSTNEEYYQWDTIPPPRSTDQCLAGRFPWGDEVMVMGKPFSEFSASENLSRRRRAEKSGCAAGGRSQSSGSSTGGGACTEGDESLHSAASDLTQAMTSTSPSQSRPMMMGARPKGSSCSIDLRHSDFASPPRGEATEPYRTCAGRVMLDREDWTHYAQQDEAKPGYLHLEWPGSLRTVGPIWIPAGYEGTFRREHAKPLTRKNPLTWTHPDLGRIRERIKSAISPWTNNGWLYTGYQPLPGQKLDSRESRLTWRSALL